MVTKTTIEDAIQQLADIGSDAVRRGLVLASGGNLSVRLDKDSVLITSSGTWLDRLTDQDFSVIDLDGQVLSGNPRPSSEWKLHTRSYGARSDVKSVVHLHPQMSMMVDALGHEIRLLTMDHANYVRKVARTDFYHNASDELADTAAAASLDANCIIMAYHGCSCVGPSAEMAYRRALNLEQAAEMTYRLLSLGDTHTAFPADAFAQLRHN
jgi:L-ribulose-5-phosphate 4-epimerase